MARKIEHTEEDQERIRLSNENKRRSLFDIPNASSKLNHNELPDNTIEKIASKLELLKSTNQNILGNKDFLTDNTDNLSGSKNTHTDKKTGSIDQNITDNLSDTDNYSVTDKKTVTDKISEPITIFTDKKTGLSNILTDNNSESDKKTVSNTLTICQDIIHNLRGYYLNDSIKIAMILDINLNSDLPFSARNFLTVLLTYTSHTWFDLSIYKFLKFVNLEERNFYRFRKDLDKVCYIEVVNKTTVFNFIDLYFKHSINSETPTENIPDNLSVSNYSKLVSNNTSFNLLTNTNADKKSVTDNLSGIVKKNPSSYLVQLATEDFLKKVLLIPGFDTETYYSKSIINQISQYQSDNMNNPEKDLNLLALCMYSNEKCNKKETIYNYVFASLKKGALDTLVNKFKEQAEPYNNLKFDDLDKKSISDLLSMCQLCNLNQVGSWGDLFNRLQEKKKSIDELVSKLCSE